MGRIIYSCYRQRRVKPSLMLTLAKKVATAIRRNSSECRHRCIVYPYWEIDRRSAAKNAKYPHLILLTTISAGNSISMKLLKIEFDDGTRNPHLLMRKMMHTPGYAVLLCPETSRFDKFIHSYQVVVKGEEVMTNGIFFGVIEDVLSNGLLGSDFMTLNGTTIQFHPKEQAHVP